ncbi:MAG: FAD-dependent oxidoreductase [Spirochaetales bacterium]|nr:FAD-dependent oxidoreductase [Spirochaetales bacterium]
MNKLKTIAAAVLLIAVTMGFTGCGSKPSGTYTSTSRGLFGPVEVSVELEKGEIKAIEIGSHHETMGVGDVAFEKVPARIIEAQSTNVDIVSGATITSFAVINAVTDSLNEAGFKAKESKTKAETPADAEVSTDIVIVGGGGAGLAAAVAATDAGARVTIVEKTGFLGGNSIVSGGIFNSPNPALQDYADINSSLNPLIEEALAETPVSDLHGEVMATVRAQFEEFKQTDKKVFDSAEWFALQTWNGGDKVGDLDMLLVYAENAYPTLQWLESMGMEFTDKINSASGSLYMRTHTSVEGNGTGFINTLRNNLADKGDLITILTDTEAKSLIVEDGKVVGVNAVARAGNNVTLRANNVIMTTGGFAGNVQMRIKYAQSEKWPDLSANVISTNMHSITGDGILMARDAGAELVHMDQIQLLPYANPVTGETGDITLTYSASMYINNRGERFVKEDGRRDEMTLAIIDQPEGIMYQLFSADAVPDPAKGKTLGGKPTSHYLDNNLSGYVQAETVEGLAEILGMDPATLQNTIDEFNSYVRGEAKDPHGRVTWTKTLENGPWYAYPRKPATHHTMGGVKINEFAQALKADGSVVEGLYCAGEITGNLHGANRLGGNAIVDFCVFGRIAGEQAAAN